MDDYVTPDKLEKTTSDLFTWIKENKLKINIDSETPLEQVALAHEKLEKRQTKGKVLLKP